MFFKAKDDLYTLPVGMAEFNVFADRIISKAGSFADADSMRWALAGMIMHAKEGEAAFSDQYFISRLVRAAANQVASQVFVDIKTKQAEALAKQQAEATADIAVADDQPKKD